MVSTPKIKVLKYTQAIMSRMGFYSDNFTETTDELFNSPIAYYFLTVEVLGVLMSFAFVFVNMPQLDIISQPTLVGVGTTASLGMLLNMGLKSKSVKMLHLKLQEIADEAENEPEAHQIYWNVEEKCRIFTRIFSNIIFANGVFLFPLLQSTYDILSGEYDISNWILPFSLVVPFNTETLWGWYPLLFININIGLVYLLAMPSMTSYYISCCFYIRSVCDHFDLIIESIKQDVELNQHEKKRFKYNKREIKIKKNLCKAINTHINVYKTFDLVADINSGAIFTLLPPSVIYLALSFYNMEHSEFDIVTFTTNIVSMICGLCWAFLFAVFSQSVSDRITDTGFTTYGCNWFDYPVEVRKHVILIIARSQRSDTFTGLQLFPCTIGLFGDLLRKSASYYWAFRTMAQH